LTNSPHLLHEGADARRSLPLAAWLSGPTPCLCATYGLSDSILSSPPRGDFRTSFSSARTGWARSATETAAAWAARRKSGPRTWCRPRRRGLLRPRRSRQAGDALRPDVAISPPPPRLQTSPAVKLELQAFVERIPSATVMIHPRRWVGSIRAFSFGILTERLRGRVSPGVACAGFRWSAIPTRRARRSPAAR